MLLLALHDILEHLGAVQLRKERRRVSEASIDILESEKERLPVIELSREIRVLTEVTDDANSIP